MLTEINKAARFLPKRKFRFNHKVETSASLTTGCNRQGSGHFLQVLGCIFVTVMLSSTGLARPLIFTENYMSCLISLLRFFGGAMLGNMAYGKYPVRGQLDCFWG